MKYVRIGNDIGIKWYIFRNCAVENLTHANAKVYLFDRNGRQQVFNYTIEDGYIQGTFYGKDQVTTGNYRLVLTENEGNKEMVTLDYIDAFVLSAKLKNMTQSGEDAAIGIKTEVVELSSTISTDKQFVDLTDYVKREELEIYAKATDLESYALKEHTHSQYLTEHQDLSAYAKKTELFSKDYNDLTNKPTIPSEYDDTQVRNLIAGKQDKLSASQIANLNVDHSKYLTKHQDLSAYAKKVDLQSYAKATDLQSYAKATDLQSYALKNHTHSQYALKTDIPDTSSYLTSESDPTVPAYVKSIKQSDIDAWNAATSSVDLSNYVTKNDLDTASYITADQVTHPDYSNTYAPLVHTHNQYLTEHQDLSAYVKTTDLQSYALKTDIPDTSNFATKDEIVPAYDDTQVRNLIAGKQDKLTESQIANLNADHSKYLTKHQTLPDYSSTYANINHTHDQYLTEHQDLSAYAKKTELFSKDYNDLTNKPIIPSEYNDTEVRNLIAGKQDKLTESQIANLNADHSKYLTQHQTLPDYSNTYAPLVHTHDQYLTEHQDLSAYALKTDIPDTSSYLTSESDPTVPAYVKSIKQSDIDAWNAATGGVDLSNYVTKNDLDAASYITADQVTHPDYSTTYAKINHTHSEYLTEHQDLSAYALKTELFSKDYNDLTNKPTIPSEYDDTQIRNLIASKQDKLTESQIANLNADHSKYLTKHQTLPDYSNTYANINHTHNQYLTEHQDLSAYALKTDIPDTSSYLTSESDPTVPAYVKSITEADINNWNTKYDDTNVLSRLDSIEATLGDAYTISENILNA